MDIELRPGFSCLLSKRDATCYFDQLAPPKRLRRFFGRPPIIEGDFTRTGDLSLIHLRRYLDTTGDLKPGTILYLVSCCWPAGNSRSSFVAQSVLLKCCLNAGLNAKHFLCIETPPPLRTDGCFALATDDIVHVTLQGPLHSHRRVSDIDKALVDHGIERNAEKDVTAATNGTALETDLVDGAYFAPAIKKLEILLAGVTSILKQRLLSPLEMHTHFLVTTHGFSYWPGHHFRVSMRSTALRASQMSESKQHYHQSV